MWLSPHNVGHKWVHTLNMVRWYDADVNHLEWICYKASNWHSSFSLRREATSAGPLCFVAVTARRGLSGHPRIVLQGKGHRWRSGLAFSVGVVKYWNRLPTLVIMTTYVNIHLPIQWKIDTYRLKLCKLVEHNSNVYIYICSTCVNCMNWAVLSLLWRHQFNSKL